MWFAKYNRNSPKLGPFKTQEEGWIKLVDAKTGEVDVESQVWFVEDNPVQSGNKTEIKQMYPCQVVPRVRNYKVV